MIKIIKAFWNLIFNKEEALANKRSEICNSCDKVDKKGTHCVLPGTQPCCSFCGCSIKLLSRSVDSECPHPDGNKWKNVKI